MINPTKNTINQVKRQVIDLQLFKYKQTRT